jgi:AcrR family transcriptional regulator
VLADEELPKPPTQDRSRRKREALLAAAMHLFAERGYEATGIDAIAARAGVAVGGFYGHFGSKRQLLLVLVDRLIAEMDGLDFSLVLQAEDERKAVEGLVRSGLRADWAHAGVYRAWREAVLGDPALDELNRRIDDWSRTRIELALTAIGRFPRARRDLDIEALAAILNGLFWRVAETPESERARVADALVDMIVRAVLNDLP